ncbi:MAG: TonB-dependent receptor [Gammaproteobacteria bacterium]|nr:TonB-dependent receptor [Gammaproteobacteria bacterium]
MKTPRQVVFTSALVTALLAMASPLRAGDAPYALGEIVVTGHRPAVESIGTVRELDAGDLERAGIRSVDEALALLPGVNVRVGGDGTPRVDVRGLRTRQVKLLVNGIPFNAAADGQFDPTLIPAEFISKVKLTTGAGSQLYGDGAIAGAINIVTRQGAGKPAASVRAEAGDGDHQRLVGTYSAATDHASVFVSLGHQSRDGWPLADAFESTTEENGGWRNNSDRRRENVYANATWEPGAAWSLGATLSYVQGEHGIPGSTIDDPSDIYANRPRYDRVDAEHAYYLQLNAAWAPGGAWRNDSWVYYSNLVEDTNRYVDATFVPVTDASVKNSFTDETRTRIYGFHNHTTWEHPLGGNLTFLIEGRQERLDEDCVVQDVPLPAPAPSAVPPPPVPPAPPPDTFALELTNLSTNDHGFTTAAGGNDPVARLTATNRPGGGIDFTLESLAIDEFGPGSYLQAVLLSPGPGVDTSAWSWSQGIGSDGEIGNILFSNTDDADGYAYPIRVNFRRPGQGDPLLAGETGQWFFDTGDVTDLFSVATPRTGPAGDDMFAAIRIRGTDASGFWGVSGVDFTGGGPTNRVFVQAPAAIVPGGAGPPPPPITPADGGTGGGALLARSCSGGGGGGAGTGGGVNRVERVAGARFGRRLLTQERAVEVFTTALEYTMTPFARTGLVFGAGHHWFVRDDGTSTEDSGINAGIYYDLTASTRLRASAARKLRIPSISQLYNPQGGNPGLAFETAWAYEAGVSQDAGRYGRIDLTGFVQDVDNFIQRDAVTGLFANVEKSHFHGVEINAESRYFDHLLLRASYTRLHTRDESPGATRKQIQYVPEHKLIAQAAWDVTAAVSACASLSYIADQYFYARGGSSVRAQLDDYALADLKLSWAAIDDRVRLYVGADNVFDRNYEESYGLPQAGRFVYGGVEITLF